MIHRGLNSGVGTFSEALRRAGYELSYSGKWHISDIENPSDRGWEDLEITAGRGGDNTYRSLDRWRGQVREAEMDKTRERGQIRRPGWGDYQLYQTVPAQGPLGYDEHPDWIVVQSGLQALERLTNQSAPWCLYVGPQGPHDPFEVPEPFVRRYDPAEIPLPPNFYDSLEDKPRVYQRMRQQLWDQLTENEVRESIAHYWAYCTLEDTYFGMLLDALEASGQRDDTLVLRLSDHGEYAGAHGLFLKGIPAFREGYQIACIASWPAGIVEPGRVVDECVTLADIAPTLLEVAGLPIAPELAGQSLMPFLHDETPIAWPETFHSQFNGTALYYTQRIVQTKEYKYVFNGFDFDELYDLRVDPHEMLNVSDQPDYQDIKYQLVQEMWRFADANDDFILNPYPMVALAPWGPMDVRRE